MWSLEAPHPRMPEPLSRGCPSRHDGGGHGFGCDDRTGFRLIRARRAFVFHRLACPRDVQFRQQVISSSDDEVAYAILV